MGLLFEELNSARCFCALGVGAGRWRGCDRDGHVVIVMLGVFVIPRDQGPAGLQRDQMVRLLPAVDSDREDPARGGQPFPREVSVSELVQEGILNSAGRKERGAVLSLAVDPWTRERPRSIPCRHLLPDGGGPVVLMGDESGQHFNPDRVRTIGRDTGHEPPGPWYGPWYGPW